MASGQWAERSPDLSEAVAGVTGRGRRRRLHYCYSPFLLNLPILRLSAGLLCCIPPCGERLLRLTFAPSSAGIPSTRVQVAMAGSRQTIGPSVATTVVAVLVAMCGCTSSPPATHATALSLEAGTTPPSPQITHAGASGYHPEQQALGSAYAPDPREMHQVIADIQELGAMDPRAREELLENLKQTDPTLWPLVVQQVRASLAWRQRVKQQDMADGGSSVALHSTEQGRGVRDEGRGTMGKGREKTDQSTPTRSSPLAPNLSLAGEFEPGARDEARRTGHDGKQGTDQRTLARTSHLAPSPSTLSPDRQTEDEPATEVIAASHESKANDDWQTHLEEAIRQFEADCGRSAESDGESARQARLRMLYLLADRRDDALRPIRSLDPAMQEFWSKQLYGLATLVDPQLISRPFGGGSEISHRWDGRRRAQAREHLEAAMAKLRESCPLVVRNLAFATEIELFGRYKPFEKYEFQPGQEVLLYAELENFESRETPRGFHTATRSSYQIFDSSGRRVAEHEFSPSEEYSPTARRDYFIGHQFTLPRRIFPGKHVLQLTVADLNSEKIGQSLIEFVIKSTDD